MAGLSCNKNLKLIFYFKSINYRLNLARKESTKTIDDEEFRVLELYPKKGYGMRPFQKRVFDNQSAPPREKRMPIDQDWPSVWPTAKTFRPSVVPLPIYQGYDKKRAPPFKYANTELIKIPNFLHLTPPAIKRHCAAIKKFCTKWPEALSTDEDCAKHFPLTVITTDYLHSAPTIRDERSRIVTLKLKLNDLNLDYHGRDKILRLLGERYHQNDDSIVMVADRCPLRKQNYDYLMYLLTALHHESWVTEPWEHEKTEADMEKFFFEGSRIQNKMTKTLHRMKTVTEPDTKISEDDVKASEEVQQFGEAVADLINTNEEKEAMEKYKQSVLKVFNLEAR